MNADHEPLIITRDHGKPAAVLMSLEDYASFEETSYLLKTPRNAERLLESVAELDSGQGSEHELAERISAFPQMPGTTYQHWQTTDPKLLTRLNALLRECARTPFTGTGKPVPLRGNLSGWRSRRITQEHRLVYKVSGETLFIAQCRYHY